MTKFHHIIIFPIKTNFRTYNIPSTFQNNIEYVNMTVFECTKIFLGVEYRFRGRFTVRAYSSFYARFYEWIDSRKWSFGVCARTHIRTQIIYVYTKRCVCMCILVDTWSWRYATVQRNWINSENCITYWSQIHVIVKLRMKLILSTLYRIYFF